MNELLQSLIGLTLFCTIVPSRPTWSMAEQWSQAQKGAWETIESHWQKIVQGDVESFISYIHPQFTGFGHESPLMIDRDTLEKWVGFWTKTTKIPVYELQPVHINVFGDQVAVVHYYIFTVEKTEKEGKRVVRRYTTTLLKENGKWLIIGNQNQLMGPDY
jgi:hypothetical protein